ncbi:hypothetical protein F5888DRAFT_370329 [Russula emetica]|nr:hypothetical protein F5888DRAFT_370329 [Russula emetica]
MSRQSPNNQGPLIALWSDGQEFFAYPQNNPVSPTASTAGLAAEVSVGYNHGWPASDHGDEVSRSLDFDCALPMTTITALPVYYFQLGPQYNSLPYQTRPLGAREHPTIQNARDHGKRSVRPKVKLTCCKKEFGRIQEYKRHQKDVHEPPRQCPFCLYQWTRPGKIKHHIKSCHGDEFLGEFEVLRGKEIVEFLDRHYYGLEVGTMPDIPSLDFPDFPYLP